MLRWNPHFHAIVLEGGYDAHGTIVHIPLGSLEAMTELLRRRVIALLVDRKLLDRTFARTMLSWRHSGCSIDNSVRILVCHMWRRGRRRGGSAPKRHSRSSPPTSKPPRRSPTIPTPAHVARPGHGCARGSRRSIRWSVRAVATR